jgi:biopolymer transport protein TolR
MAVKLGGGDQPISEINVTPMVDIMLVLLIIFMVTAPMMKQGVDVDLPESVANPVSSESDRLILTLTGDKKIFLGEAEIDRRDLLAKIGANEKVRSGKSLYLHADRSLNYGEVVTLMGELQRAGVRKLGMITDPMSAQ